MNKGLQIRKMNFKINDKQYNLYIYDCIKRYKTYTLHSELVVNQLWS